MACKEIHFRSVKTEEKTERGPLHDRLHCKRSKWNCPDISSVLAIRKPNDQGRYDWHLCNVVRVNNRAEMRVSVEYYDGEPREALKKHEEEWGIISCPEKRTAPSREVSAVDRLAKSMKKEAAQDNRLVRKVLLNCVKPTHETLYADVPNLGIENATKMSKDRKLWSNNRPSLRSQTLSGGVAIK